MVLALVAATLQDDSLRLPIPGPGTVHVAPGQIVETATGKVVTPDDVAKSARGKAWVFLGENHATTAHQNLHAAIIDALARDGRNVAVGLEMLQRPKQGALDAWVRGDLLRTQFIKEGDWIAQWGYGFRFYDPIFTVCRDRKIPMVGLNVPRDWVRSVGRGGFAALSPEAKSQLPATMSLDNASHKQVFISLIGGHPMAGPRGDNMYAAQVLWDEGMADTAIKYTDAHPRPNSVFVVLAGSGHVMYRQGINYRVSKRGKGDGITVVMAQSDVAIDVSKGLGDFVFVSAPQK